MNKLTLGQLYFLARYTEEFRYIALAELNRRVQWHAQSML